MSVESGGYLVPVIRIVYQYIAQVLREETERHCEFVIQ